jgi:beta-lactamase regulating signal transducer with metallopeptidase domain
MSDILIYLFQVSVCHIAFYALYWQFLRKHTFFQSNRIYLLFTTLLGFIIPLLNIGIWKSESIENALIYPFFSLSDRPTGVPVNELAPQLFIMDKIFMAQIVLIFIYVIGLLLYIFRLIRSIRKVASIVRNNHAIDKGGYKMVRIKKGPSFFSFMNYIFINDHELDLASDDLENILTHEQIHIQQRHTIDILFMELATALCWFNPLIKNMKVALCQIHEFIADRNVASNTREIEKYAQLILRLSSKNSVMPLTHQFSMVNVRNRIIMLNQTKNDTMKKLKLLFALPLVLLLMALFSFTERTVEISADTSTQMLSASELKIGNISWEGNTRYSDAMLTKILGMKKGDAYSKELIKSKLSYKPARDDIGSLYMDNGYLFYNVTPKEEIIGNSVNINFIIYEGHSVEIGKIIIKGNSTIESSKVLEMINFKSGEFFNRSKIVQSQKNIAGSGFFKKDEVGINPIPNQEQKTVDIEFVLIEI